jgi:hypothetical protein
MKSVDRDFDPKGSSGFNWPLAYMFFAFGAIFMLSRTGLSYYLSYRFKVIVIRIPIGVFSSIQKVYQECFERESYK